ncbi:hypothetical protein [Lichenifustis flavocetrariae]|uniref:Cytochrome c domain-containing protein n=1 Tax=Lichenifustis flavocetrariae TaxID=2949735 RepID=A0AA42CNI3_9HYPH|nr:hypothetical protein [Lichenifustis flavocetrariae]MCW6512826.1 hypothetical protein [Lichenifustis flavocetrariae]
MSVRTKLRGAGAVRRLASFRKDAAQTRRLMALAAIYEGGRRLEAARTMSILLLSLALLLQAGHGLALERPSVDLETRLDAKACSMLIGGTGLAVDQEVALGLVAFNSPYLFGGKALHDDITCGACHNDKGASGAVVRLRFRKPVPNLREASERGIDVASFVDHAVVSEFGGQPAVADVTRALAALARVFAVPSAALDSTCRIGPAGLVDIALRRLAARLGQIEVADADFLIDSARFVLGEMVRDPMASNLVSRAMIDDANQTLHDLLRIVDEKATDRAVLPLRALTERWEASMRAEGLVPIVLTDGVHG